MDGEALTVDETLPGWLATDWSDWPSASERYTVALRSRLGPKASSGSRPAFQLRPHWPACPNYPCLLAEDQVMVGEALANLLSLEADIEVVAQVGRGDEVVAAVVASRPDVALLDIEMPGQDGLAVSRRRCPRGAPNLSRPILTTFGRPGYLRRAMDVGAEGFRAKTHRRPSWPGRYVAP